MVERPQKIKVGCHTYTVLYSKKQWLKHEAADYVDNCSGLCWPEQSLILIKGWELSNTQIKEVIFHELAHAALALCMYQNLPSKPPKSRHDIEEELILLSSPVILMILQDNPDLVSWLTQ